MTKTVMTTRTQLLAAALGALSTGASGLLACERGERQATEVPAAAGEQSSGGVGDGDGECLHSEGCCGGHKEGDNSCGGERAAADHAEDDDAHAAVAGPQRYSWTVEPGKAVEINVELTAGAQMSARFEAAGALAWNVHSHPDGQPKIHAEGDATAGAPAFVAREAGVYSFLWINKGDRAIELTVELRIDGGGRIHSTHPETAGRP